MKTNPLSTVETGNSQQWLQIVATMSASLCSIGIGLQFGWPSPSLPKILSDEYPADVTHEEASYILVIGPLGYLVGAPLSGITVNRIGRKKCLLLLAIPQLLSWILIANSKSIIILYVARLIACSAEAGLLTVFPMYVGEICEPKVRGILGSSLSVCIFLGVWMVNLYGSYLSLEASAYVSCIVPLLFLLLFSWMPESPYYLLMKNQKEDAKKSLMRLRRMRNVDKELTTLTLDVQRQLSEAGGIKELFTINSNRKAFAVLFWIRTFQQLCGISVFGFYSQIIFQHGGDFLSPKTSSNIYFAVQLVVSFIASLLIDKFGRKPLYIISSVLTSLTLFIVGTYFFFKETGNDVSHFEWLPLVGMNLYIIVFSIGLAIVPNLMMSEIFSSSIKAKALGISTIYFALCLSVMAQVFHIMNTEIGVYSSFYLFGASTLVSSIYGYLYMPETKGKTLEEIQQGLKGNKTIHNENS